jgi:hypothetical protein
MALKVASMYHLIASGLKRLREIARGVHSTEASIYDEMIKASR